VVADRAGVAQGEPGQVPPDTALCAADAGRQLAAAAAADSTGDLPGACQLACDALRKSAASLPGAQGLRATSRGGHIAVQDPVTAQFGSSIRALRSFSRLRRARSSFEYPGTETPGPSEDDVKDAIGVAREVNDAAGKILESGTLSPWQVTQAPARGSAHSPAAMDGRVFVAVLGCGAQLGIVLGGHARVRHGAAGRADGSGAPVARQDRPCRRHHL
jgi:hypothetical protein